MNDKIFKIGVVLVMLVSLGMSSCKKSTDLLLTISQTQWSMVHETTGFDNIYLRLSGSTAGDRVTVKTYGDGLIDQYELPLNVNKEFDDTVLVVFSHVRYSFPQKFSTVVKAYRNNENVEILLESDYLY